MIFKDNLLKKLRGTFDLNIYEAKMWAALLSRGTATAGELSDISNVPRSRSYDVLESLEKKGFIMMKLGKPIKYMAIQPDEIIKRLKDRIHDRAEEKIKFIEEVKGEPTFSELELLYKQGIEKIDPYSLVGSIKSRDNIYTHVKTMLERAEHSVVIATSAQGLARKAKRYKSMFRKLADKGVKIRMVGPMTNGINMKDINEIKDIVDIRTSDKIRGRFIIVDGKEMVFMISDDKTVHESYDTAVWVNTPFFTQSFSELFESTWKGLK